LSGLINYNQTALFYHERSTDFRGESGILTQLRREGQVNLALPPLSAMIIIIVNREERNSFSTNLSISPELWVDQWGRKLDESSLQLACHPLRLTVTP
jgi:hypothetical protein